MAGTLTNAPCSLIAVLASALSWLLKTEPWPLTVLTEAVPTASNAELGLVGLGGIEVSRDGGEDEVRAGRAGEAPQKGELRWRREGLRIAGRRLSDPGLEARGQVDRVELVGLVTAENGQRIGRGDRVDGHRADERSDVCERSDECAGGRVVGDRRSSPS